MSKVQYYMHPDYGYTAHVGGYTADGKALTDSFWQKQVEKQHKRILTAQLTASAFAVISLLELLYILTH